MEVISQMLTMTCLKKIFIPFLLLLTTMTMACSNTSEEKKTSESKKEATTMAFPKHPGTIKMITMLDNTIKIKPISEIPERHQFVFYNSNNNKVDKKDAVRAVPIVEVRMHSSDGGKLVPTKDASYLYTEMYDADGNIIDTNTMWRSK